MAVITPRPLGDFSYIPLKDLGFSRMPITLKILLENLARRYIGKDIPADELLPFQNRSLGAEIFFYPSRILMQDFTGVPALVDLAAMRKILVERGYPASLVHPKIPVDLVVDHSLIVDAWGNDFAFEKNLEKEYSRNHERYRFLKWAQSSFNRLRIVPPGAGICHQVNLEILANVVSLTPDGMLIPDTVVGTDSHTTMINALSVLGWGVGGIEAESALLGEPISLTFPEVVGVRVTGKLRAGVLATDAVLTLTETLRKKNVVGKFIEFFGEGLSCLSLEDRATLANMAPEYGATCGFFPVDDATLRYLTLTGRDNDHVQRVKHYAQIQGMWRTDALDFDSVLEWDLSEIRPCVAGPKRPEDRLDLEQLKTSFVSPSGHLGDNSVVLAAITSCTNTSNPRALIAAGLLARKAGMKGLSSPSFVKKSLAPGSQVATDYLERSGLLEDLKTIGFHLVGYGCTTCIGNSGSLEESVETKAREGAYTFSAVLSGNRNFEGRVHPLIKQNYLASPPLVVAFSLAATTNIDLGHDAIGHDPTGLPVFLKDIWPTDAEIDSVLEAYVSRESFIRCYNDLFDGEERWRAILPPYGESYTFDPESTYIACPPFLSLRNKDLPLKGARILAMFGDSITTDHISPAGNIALQSPAAKFLRDHNEKDLNSYGSRRGHHEVMMRGTFANIRLQNECVPEKQGGWARYKDEVMSIYEAAMRHEKDETPLIIIAGKNYGSGSSRDWAAKGTRLLGIRAVIAESFERIHRSNLVGMGVLPLQLSEAVTRKTLNLEGNEAITISGVVGVRSSLTLEVKGHLLTSVICRIDTETELEYYRHGGLLPYILRSYV